MGFWVFLNDYNLFYCCWVFLFVVVCVCFLVVVNGGLGLKKKKCF